MKVTIDEEAMDTVAVVITDLTQDIMDGTIIISCNDKGAAESLRKLLASDAIVDANYYND